MRIGLTIGINDYPGTDADLRGCVNDATGWAAELDRRGFTVTELHDRQATRLRIIDAIENAVGAARWGDIAVITFSGHGTWDIDRDGDEPDGRDEALCPADVTDSGPLSDDTLHDLFAQRRHGARLVFISDSCHSGTVTRFAAPLTGTGAGRRVRFLPPEHHLEPRWLPAARALAAAPPRGKSRPTALLMSGCADTEYSYDGYGQVAMGAFSAVALDTLKGLPAQATYRDWHRAIRTRLPAVDTPQTPQLFGTRTQLAWPIFAEIS